MRIKDVDQYPVLLSVEISEFDDLQFDSTFAQLNDHLNVQTTVLRVISL